LTFFGYCYFRLAVDEREPELADALSATEFSARQGQEPEQALVQSSRRLAQAAVQTNVGIASTDLGCDGCSGYDNRIQVRHIMR
jgi:hypothetical protein